MRMYSPSPAPLTGRRGALVHLAGGGRLAAIAGGAQGGRTCFFISPSLKGFWMKS